jgi:hypothetical protein
MTDPAAWAITCRVESAPIREWCRGQCSCIAAARDCAASDGRANPLPADGGSQPPGAIDPILPVQGMLSPGWTANDSTKMRAWAPGQSIPP